MTIYAQHTVKSYDRGDTYSGTLYMYVIVNDGRINCETVSSSVCLSKWHAGFVPANNWNNCPQRMIGRISCFEESFDGCVASSEKGVITMSTDISFWANDTAGSAENLIDNEVAS